MQVQTLLEEWQVYVNFQLTWNKAEFVQAGRSKNQSSYNQHQTCAVSEGHKVNHKFLVDIKSTEQDTWLDEGNKGTESDGTTPDSTWKPSLKQTYIKALRMT